MATHSPSKRARLRTFFVVALSLFVIAENATDVKGAWKPWGGLGYSDGPDNVVQSVYAGSPAAEAGIQPGDQIDLRSTAPKDRGDAANGATGHPGERVTFALIHQGRRRDITLSAIQFAGSSGGYRIVRFCIALLWVLIGAALVLLRPNLTTWGFFLYCLGNNPGIDHINLLLQYPWPVADAVVSNFIGAAGVAGGIVFALCFLNEPPKGWRLSALRLTPWFFVGLTLFYLFGTYLFWSGYPPETNGIGQILLVLIPLLMIGPLVATYVNARGVDRQRIGWVVVAIVLSAVALSISAILNQRLDYNAHLVLFHALELFQIIVPIAVAYAVIKHRVIDVSFVVSRALVYGVLTTLLVAVFSIIDWFFVDYLRLARLGTIAEVGAVVAFGLWFNGLHERVDYIIDATFFRQRHKAEVQLARVSAALPFATTTSAVANCLIDEPARAMSLASAALFRRDRDGVYTREHSEGWDGSTLLRLDDSDETLLMLAQTENGPLSLYDHPWRTHGVPSGPAHPVLALPIIVRRELAAIVFYGAHIHGEALDPDEIKVIAALASGAAVAYDHLEAEAMKREVESIRRRNEALEAQLAEAQIQPA